MLCIIYYFYKKEEVKKKKITMTITYIQYTKRIYIHVLYTYKLTMKRVTMTLVTCLAQNAQNLFLRSLYLFHT